MEGYSYRITKYMEELFSDLALEWEYYQLKQNNYYYYLVYRFFIEYGWYLLGASLAALMLSGYFQPLEAFRKWQQARKDAAFHKDPARVLARRDEVQRAREAQQQQVTADSEKAAEMAQKRKEQKTTNLAEMLDEYGAATSANRLSSKQDHDNMPLSDGGSMSSYQAPKRSTRGGGGCGR